MLIVKICYILPIRKRYAPGFLNWVYIWLELKHKATQEVLKIIGTSGKSIPLVFKPQKSNWNYYKKQNFCPIEKARRNEKIEWCTVEILNTHHSRPLNWCFIKTSWLMFRVLPQLSPLGSYLPHLRAFQWGTGSYSS